MFSRRHPFLFFVLVFSAIVAVTVLLSSLISLVAGKRGEARFTEKVGVIEVGGVITDSRQVLEHLRTFREKEGIKAIVLRVNSPGGAVGPTQEIYREVRKTAEVKKVVASLGTVAASGGYYVASAADRIMANPGTVTGSIGVILGYTNFEELFEKIGLRPVVIKSGKYKDLASPLKEMSDAERAVLQKFTDDVHAQFIGDVATGRDLSPEAIRRIADGRIFTGEIAEGHGLVDRMGNLEDAIEWAGRLGGIDGKVRAVYPPEKKPSIIRYLVDMTVSEIKSQLAESAAAPAGYIYMPGK